MIAPANPAGQWSTFLEIAGRTGSDDLAAVVPPYADPAGVAVLGR